MPARRTNLKVVGPDDVPPKHSRVSGKIVDSLSGSSRDLLASMRLALARKLDSGEISSNAIASAYKELREIDRQIRVLDADSEASLEGEDVEDVRFDATAI